MKCEICKEAEAKVHLTQIINGTMQKVDLCENCAKTKGVDNPTGFSLADMFMGLGHTEGSSTFPPSVELRCPSCGMGQSDFKKSGRLGCAKCYETFAEPLSSLIKSMHKGSHHVGKRLGEQSRVSPAGDELQSLRKKLEEAVKAENFESAASLRDQIRKLEEEARKGQKT